MSIAAGHDDSDAFDDRTPEIAWIPLNVPATSGSLCGQRASHDIEEACQRRLKTDPLAMSEN